MGSEADGSNSKQAGSSNHDSNNALKFPPKGLKKPSSPQAKRLLSGERPSHHDSLQVTIATPGISPENTRTKTDALMGPNAQRDGRTASTGKLRQSMDTVSAYEDRLLRYTGRDDSSGLQKGVPHTDPPAHWPEVHTAPFPTRQTNIRPPAYPGAYRHAGSGGSNVNEEHETAQEEDGNTPEMGLVEATPVQQEPSQEFAQAQHVSHHFLDGSSPRNELRKEEAA